MKQLPADNYIVSKFLTQFKFLSFSSILHSSHCKNQFRWHVPFIAAIILQSVASQYVSSINSLVFNRPKWKLTSQSAFFSRRSLCGFSAHRLQCQRKDPHATKGWKLKENYQFPRMHTRFLHFSCKAQKISYSHSIFWVETILTRKRIYYFVLHSNIGIYAEIGMLE